MLCRIMLPFLPAGAACCATLRRAIFSPTGYEQFPFFTNSPSFWEQRLMEKCVLSSSFPSISLPIQQSTPRASICTRFLPVQLVRSSTPSPPPCSRGGRPVSAGTIGKQRPKMCLPVSSSSLTSKHSNGPWKNTMRPQFLLTMIFIAAAQRPPPRKFDKSQNL